MRIFGSCTKDYHQMPGCATSHLRPATRVYYYSYRTPAPSAECRRNIIAWIKPTKIGCQWQRPLVDRKQFQIGHLYSSRSQLRVETLGPLNASALNFLIEVGRRLTSSSGDSRETSFLFQRLSMLIQRFNSALIIDSFCFSDEDPDLQPPRIFVVSFQFLTPGIYTTRGIKNNNNNNNNEKNNNNNNNNT